MRYVYRNLRRAWPFAVALAVMTAGACTEETIVFRDRDPFNPPPDAAFGFLGYFEPAAKQTTCGNCHVGIQGAWEQTAHADALNSLVGSGHAQSFCYGCHTISELGNIADTTAGWNALQVPDSVVDVPEYHDVQCESCHGPGLDHVTEPGTVQPLASIVADTGLTNGCGECHEGTHHPFVEQWAESRHAAGGSFSRGSNASCQPCHNGRAFIEQFSRTRFAEEDTLVTLNVTCAVCHDPHGSPHDAQLRLSISTPTIENLCVSCHSRKGTPPAGFRGPHASQGLLVLGQNVGWIPPVFAYDTTQIAGSHGTDANPRLCASCHVPFFEVDDAATGEFLLNSVGHTFEAIQCLDAQGLPTAGPCPIEERTFQACATSGCHGNETAARTAFSVVKARMEFLLDQLWFDTDGNATLDATDDGLLPQIIATDDTLELYLRDDSLTVAEGAFFNGQLAFTSDREYWGGGTMWGESFSAHKGSGEGVHNPFILEALLTASIQAVMNEYGISPTAPLQLLQPQLEMPAGIRQIR